MFLPGRKERGKKNRHYYKMKGIFKRKRYGSKTKNKINKCPPRSNGLKNEKKNLAKRGEKRIDFF